MNTTYRKNLKDVATACKNYTDTQIAQAKEEIYWHIGEYSVTTSDDNTSASVKTVPSNATRCKIKRVYGNTQKLNPTTASDSTSAMMKTMPSTVYDFDVSKVEGVSYKINQLVQNGNFSENSGWSTNAAAYVIANNKMTITAESTSQAVGITKSNVSLIGGHKHLISFILNPSVSGYTRAWFNNELSENIATTLNTDNKYKSIFTPTNTATGPFILYLNRNGNTVGDTGYFKNVMLFDLTAMGIDTTDVATATSELLKRGIDINEYQAYDVGSIRNFAWTDVKVEGANVWDEEWEVGVIDTNGVVSSGTKVISKNFIPVEPNKTYYFYCASGSNAGVHYYYQDKSGVMSGVVAINNGAGTFTVPNNVYYIKFNLADAYGTAYKNDICINVSNAEFNGTYVPYITPTTLPIDLSTILYNGSPLFEGNSLKAVNDVKDSITPYKATKKLGYLDLGTLDWVYTSSRFRATITNYNYISASNTPNALMPMYTAYPYQTDLSLYSKSYTISSAGLIVLNDTSYTDAETFKTAMSGVYLVYELATPIEVSINWVSTLRGITGYSNGTITLQNTYNMDSANTITYNSIIKENCCAKMVQSRNGSVIKTINFPTQASDGYSAGSVANVRDFTINKRIGNVSKENDLGTLDYTYVSNMFYAIDTSIKVPTNNNTIANILCSNYSNATYNQVAARLNDKTIGIRVEDNSIRIYDSAYTDATTFETAMANVPLYYELAEASKTSTDITALEENVIVVQAGDELAFYDSNDNLVTVPTDLTYRIEVAN